MKSERGKTVKVNLQSAIQNLQCSLDSKLHGTLLIGSKLHLRLYIVTISGVLILKKVGCPITKVSVIFVVMERMIMLMEKW
jgi:hypothetical protein